MIKSLFLVLGVFFLTLSCSVKEKNTTTYAEAIDPNPIDTLAWESVAKSINISVVSIDKRYSKSSVPKVKLKDTWNGNTWKGERINAQILLWSAEALEEIHCDASDLKDKEGNVINSDNIKSFFVRYVLTDEFGDGCNERKPGDYDSSIVPDALDPMAYFNTGQNEARPMWVTIDVPAECKEGKYQGTISIKAKGQKEKKIKINLSVIDRVLPEPKEWRFHLDLWQNPFAVARFHNVELWSQEHFNLLRPLVEMLANAGQKCITASITHKPWGGQTYDYFESLIKWRKLEDGTWSYDYSAFDNWIEFAMDCGITQQINCYTMIPWGNRFTYFDEHLKKDTTVEAIAGSQLYNELWAPFLEQFVIHLKEKNWQDITAIAMDERSPEEMQEMITFIKSIAPELKIALAGGYHKEINNNIYDLCVASAHKVPGNAIKERKALGHKTTFYVCCMEPFPNNFTFSPPAESAYLGWYAAANNYDGFLRWAYNSWVENPLTDSRFKKWPAGDTYFVYPGAMSSIRFERLREGIQDYEKIRIITQELINENSEESKAKLELLDKTLKTFEISAVENVPASHFVKQGKKLLLELSKN